MRASRFLNPPSFVSAFVCRMADPRDDYWLLLRGFWGRAVRRLSGAHVTIAVVCSWKPRCGYRPVQAILRPSHQRPLTPKPVSPSAETSWKLGHVLPESKNSGDELTIVSRLPAIVFLSRVRPVYISAGLCPARASRDLNGSAACMPVYVSRHRAIFLARGDDGRLPSEVIAGSAALCGVAGFAPEQMPS